jgi:hypothetical protein
MIGSSFGIENIPPAKRLPVNENDTTNNAAKLIFFAISISIQKI